QLEGGFRGKQWSAPASIAIASPLPATQPVSPTRMRKIPSTPETARDKPAGRTPRGPVAHVRDPDEARVEGEGASDALPAGGVGERSKAEVSLDELPVHELVRIERRGVS